jgi:hypothetical protein
MASEWDPVTVWHTGEDAEVATLTVLIPLNTHGLGEDALGMVALRTPSSIPLLDMYGVSCGSVRDVKYSKDRGAVIGTIYTGKKFSDDNVNVELSTDLQRVMKVILGV